MILVLDTDFDGIFPDLCDVLRLFFDEPEIYSPSDFNAAPDFSAKLVLERVNDSDTPEMCRAYAFLSNGTHYTLEMPVDRSNALIEKRQIKRLAKVALFRALKKTFPERFLPWGSLTGIRPTHLLRELITDLGDDNAENAMLKLFDVSKEKYELARAIVEKQAPYIASADNNSIDIYIGVPYCKTRCLYCSFPSGIRTAKTDMRPYIDTLKRDIALGSSMTARLGYKVRALYFGGGTPTVLTESELDEVFSCVTSAYSTSGLEFTVEAGRPDTITREKLRIMRDYGVNRVSVNPQTMNRKTLDLIGRSHSPEEIISAYDMAASMGFIVNMDLIACLPDETLDDFRHTLSETEKLSPDNLTIHTLAIKRASPLRQVLSDKGMADSLPDATAADAMVNEGLSFALKNGYTPYYMYRQKYMRGNLENVGYCKGNSVCVYNIDMMEETTSIMAHGAGAMSKRVRQGLSLRVERVPNPKDVNTYINKLDRLYEEKEKLFE